MAATYTISTYQQMGNNKTLLSIFNGTGSGEIIKIYKVWLINHAHVAGTGAYTKILLSKTSAASGGNDITSSVVKHLTSDGSPDALILFTDSSTVTATQTIRQVCYNAGTSATTIAVTYTWSQWESIYCLMRVFEAGYYNANLQPIVVRENEGFAVRQPGATATGFAEIVVEFTIE